MGYQKTSVFVIVDGYSTGAFIAPAFKKRGFDCVHVLSQANLPRNILKQHKPENYLDNFNYNKKLSKLVTKLQKYKILGVIAGSESGVELADLLSELFQVFSNGYKLSHARRDKYLMYQAVAEAGLKVAPNIKTNNLEELLAWSKDIKDKPVVLKPVRSAASDKVFFCFSDAEITNAFNNIFRATNIFGEKNSKILAQGFLKGTEYVVNTVSYEGKHYVSDSWRYSKKHVPPHGLIYDYAELLPFDHDLILNKLRNYVFKVLDALGIKFGAAHTEIMLTDDGPVLIETGARIMGAVNPKFIKEAIGHNQMEWLIESYINSQKFMQQAIKPYDIDKYLMIKMFISQKTGTLKKINHLDELKKLSSFCEMVLPEIGAHIDRTVDLFTSPGLVYLMHEDYEAMKRDYESISRLETTMFEV